MCGCSPVALAEVMRTLLIVFHQYGLHAVRCPLIYSVSLLRVREVDAQSGAHSIYVRFEFISMQITTRYFLANAQMHSAAHRNTHLHSSAFE